MKINKVLETCLYVDDLDAAEDFYSNILGLKLFAGEKERHLFFRCGNAMLLLFNPEATSKPNQDVPSHGAQGPGHVAFAIYEEDYENWKNLLRDKKVEIEKEMEWPRGGKSIYIRDPAGNSIELATPQIWGIEYQ